MGNVTPQAEKTNAVLCPARRRQLPSAGTAHLGPAPISGPAGPGRELTAPYARSLYRSATCLRPSRVPLGGNEIQPLSPGPGTPKPPGLPFNFFPPRQDHGQSWALAGLNFVCGQRGPLEVKSWTGKGWQSDRRGLRLMGGWSMRFVGHGEGMSARRP